MRKPLVVSFGLGAAVLTGCRAKEKPSQPGQLVAELRGPDAEKSGRARLQLITLGEAAIPAVAALLKSGTSAERIVGQGGSDA